jgi:hypothetical protein
MDLGNPDSPKIKPNIASAIKDPREEALAILIKSAMLVYRHMPLYIPKIKNETNFAVNMTGRNSA